MAVEAYTAEWDHPELGKNYGDLFYKRATGELPEMESSKAAARRVASMAKAGDSIVDVGCGGGHYLRSLLNQVKVPFVYHGIDRTQYFIDAARRAFPNNSSISFSIGDIFKLERADRSADIVLCNNVLLHLPSIVTPLHELIRIAKRTVLIRTLVGPTSYAIKDVGPQPDGNDFDDKGEPTAYHFLNIYSEAYLRRLLKNEPRVRVMSIERDTEFDPKKILDTSENVPNAWDATRAVNGVQVSGMIVMPFHWLTIELH